MKENPLKSRDSFSSFATQCGIMVLGHGHGHGHGLGTGHGFGFGETHPQHRPSGALGRRSVPAPQRRTIGVVARGMIGRAATTPMVRRRPATAPGEQTSSRVPGEPPLTFFGARLVAGGCLSEKRQGRHARGRLLCLEPGAASVPPRRAMTPIWRSALQRTAPSGWIVSSPDAAIARSWHGHRRRDEGRWRLGRCRLQLPR